MTGRIPELDGLRGIAILLVLLFHFAPSSGPLTAFIRVYQMGWIGVDLFFVLSGFLITGILLDTAGKPAYYRTFLVRRSLRIFPLYYAALLLACAAFYLPGEIRWREFLEQHGGWWFAAYLGNFYVVHLNAWPAVPMLIPLWSLQVEEQFYLSYPLLVAFCRRATLKRVLQGMIAAGLLLRVLVTSLAPENITAAYVLMPCRMDVLAMGGWVAIALRDRDAWLQDRRIGAVSLACGAGFGVIWWFGGGTPWSPWMRTVGYSLLDIAFTGVLIVLVAWPPSVLTRMCRNPLLVWIGTVSYGLYLLHLLAGELVRRFVEPALGVEPLTSTDMVLCIAGAMLLAGISWRWFESPILRLRDRMTRA